MQKFGRLALILLAGLSIFVAVVFLGVNLYVQSQGTQARIQQELRQRFGTALNIGRISVTPWGGLKLSGITIPQVSRQSGASFLEAKNFGLQIAFFSLFSKQLVIKEVSLVEPKVVWPQNASGKWRLPDLREQQRENAPISRSEPPAASPEAAAAEAEMAARTATPAKSKKRPAAVSPQEKNATAIFVSGIRRISVARGNFRFLDRSNNIVASFDGVGFRSTVKDASALRGSARVAKVSLRERFFLDQLKSPLRYDSNGLELSQVSARAGGGDMTGRFSIQPQAQDSPFSLEVKFRNVQADQILVQSGGPSGVVQGKLGGSLEASGKTADPNALTGSGDIFLRDGQVRQYNLLVMLGQLFQIEELMQLHLEQAQAKYHIAPGVVTIDELILRSANIHLSATGTVSFGGKLHLDSRLAINEKIRAQLFKPIRANFQPSDEPGYSAVDFEVGGTLERPKTNLLEKVVGRDLKDLVNSFWGGKSDRPKKKKTVETTPGESPSVTPSPTPQASAAAMTPAPAASP